MISKNNINNLPHAIGLYFFKKNDEYLYIGKSIDIHDRVAQHIERALFDEKEKAICEQSDTVEFLVCNSEFTALLTESKYIQQYKPKYNVIWRDDKSYLYIKIEKKVDFPHITVVRKEQSTNAIYFGPFSSTRSVRFLLKSIRIISPFCMAKQPQKKPCFYSHIGLCNPCPGSVTSENRDELKKQYHHSIQTVIRILKGSWSALKLDLERELNHCKDIHDYERAIVVRNKLLSLENLIHLRSFQSLDAVTTYNHEDALAQLASLLAVNISELSRIECYDISNLMQQQATASMVVATGGIIDKSEYRRFKIRTQGVSDMRMLAEVMKRRFVHSWKSPDLIVVDGGSPQVVTVERQLIKLGIRKRIIGLAKRPDRIVYLTQHGTKTIRPRNDHLGFRLLQQLRDEAHRFAKKYHVTLRSKNIFG